MVLAEGGDLLAVEAPVAPGAGLYHVALVEAELDLAGDVLLRLVNKGGERLAQRCVPLAVIDQFAEGDGQLLLLVHGHLVEAERLKVFVSGVEDGSARRLVYAAALHADEPVLHDVQKADAVFAAQLVELENDILRAHFDAVQRYGDACLEVEGDIGRRVRRVDGGDAHLEEALLLVLRLVARILEVETLVAEVPEVLVLGVVGLPVYLQRHVVRLSVGDLLFPGLDAPLTPGGDDGHVGDEVLESQLEPDLVVALAGAAVADGVRALGYRDLREPLGDDRPRQRGAEHVVLIHRAGLDSGDDEVVHELVRQVLDIELGRSGLYRLLLQALELVGLADVAGDGDDLAVIIVFLQPGDDDRGVQPAGICKHDFFDVRFIHNDASKHICVSLKMR